MSKLRSFLQRLGYPVEKPAVGDEALYGVVWVAGRAQKQASKALKPFGLTPVKFNYLMVVKHIGKSEGLSQREIGQRLLIDPGNVVHVLDDLERKGWVARHSGPDRRSHRIKITAKGDKLLADSWPVYKAAIREVTKGVSESQQSRLVEILSRWRDSLEG